MPAPDVAAARAARAACGRAPTSSIRSTRCAPPAVPGVPRAARRYSKTRGWMRWRTVMADGASLHSAQQQAGYRAVISYSVSIADVPASGDVRHIIESQFCAQSTNPVFREIGVWHAGTDVWLLFATPFAAPALGDHAAGQHGDARPDQRRTRQRAPLRRRALPRRAAADVQRCAGSRRAGVRTADGDFQLHGSHRPRWQRPT